MFLSPPTFNYRRDTLQEGAEREKAPEGQRHSVTADDRSSKNTTEQSTTDEVATQ